MSNSKKEIQEVMEEDKIYINIIFEEIEKLNKSLEKVYAKLNDFTSSEIFKYLTMHHCFSINYVDKLKKEMKGE